MKRYLVREQGTGKPRTFDRVQSAIAVAGEQAALAWKPNALWSVVDRQTDGRITVDFRGVVVETTGDVEVSAAATA